LIKVHPGDIRMFVIEIFIEFLILNLCMIDIGEWLDSFLLLKLPQLVKVDLTIIVENLLFKFLKLI
jgi:hypothetical protein